MSLGMVFFIIALVFFFFGGIPQTMMRYETCLIWGLFSLTLGLLLNGVSLPRKVQ